jgi:hypothetical protein
MQYKRHNSVAFGAANTVDLDKLLSPTASSNAHCTNRPTIPPIHML